MRRDQSAEPVFRCADGVLLRAPLLARPRVRATWRDGAAARPGETGAEPGELRAHLVELLADARFREALEVSSPSLARTVDAVLTDAPVAASDLRKAHRAVTRYLLRAASRPTPFGLLAGVLWGSFGEATKGELTGAGHRAARPDAGWLARLIAEWERDPAVHRGLSVVVNGLCFVRGGRLVLPFAPAGAGPGPTASDGPSGGVPGDRPTSRTLRRTPVVRAVAEAAARPVPCGDLIREVEARFPGAPEGAVAGLVAQLIGAEVLLTELRPPLDAPDPLAHVEALLPAATPAARWTAALRASLADYRRTPLGEGRAAWRRALELAATGPDAASGPDAATGPDTGAGPDTAPGPDSAAPPGAASGPSAAARPASPPAHPARPAHPAAPAHAVQVDLRLDGTAVLSRSVAEELERAASALWRLSPPGPGRLTAYHQDFVERYGLGRYVPVKELLDPDIGLGAPAGYRLPPSHRPDPGPAPLGAARQRLLLGLAAEAQARGAREVVLDEERLRGFEAADRDESADSVRPSSLELVVQIAAESAAAVDRGDFTLVLVGAATASGGFTGRFAHLFPPAQAAAIRHTARAARETTGRLPVQVHHQASHHRHANVAQVPTWLDTRLAIGVHPGPAAPGVTDLTLDDIAVGADSEGFRIVSAALGRELTPSALHVLNRELTAPNAVRFLIEAAAFGRKQWRLWEWGAAEDLPFLPAVRTGRTVLSPARWRLDATGLPLDEWRALWHVPDHVQLTIGDHRIPLNLTVPAHQEILRRECERTGAAVVHELPLGHDADSGWLHGPGGAHEAEAVVTLTPCLPEPAEAPARTTRPVIRRGTGEIPPGGPWLYATLYTSAERQDELLTGPLRRFLADLGSPPAGPSGVDRWFFIRYADPDPHLRLRLHGDPALLNGTVLPRLHDLVAELSSEGLARGLRLDSYAPETERYGGPTLLAGAEAVFHADSQLVLERLAAPADDRILSTAYDVTELVRAFHRGYGGDWRHWLTGTYPKREQHHKAFAARRRAALARITPDGVPDPAAQPYHAAPERFGRLVRAEEDRGALSVSPDAVLASLVHMHCNRRLGTDRTAEAQTLAVARGAVQAHLDRERAGA
ncbi:lantibiotic dehydratase [Streptomyces sp. MNP-20]|uniref:lantibiotic dehydratase n=1 Tax=Streptomyces sp. MNP-20 TaxID=2721165 RepID=UPI001554DC19|nr:lantibiotic dehydratase [Streptomyces sp. MNP-20]